MAREEAVNWIISLSADIGKAEHQSLWHYEQALAEIKNMLEAEPERKTGKWRTEYDERFNIEYCQCSECGYAPYKPIYISPYCPNCGAKMEGE